MFLCLKKDFEEIFPKEVVHAVEISAKYAASFGVNIFLIGGIVRDLILKKVVQDIDIAVEGNAVEFAEFLKTKTDCEILQVQENLKTAKVKFASGVQIDFASTREETYSKSGILPVAYNFGCCLEQDVKRRDFTINTLALNLTGNERYMLIDSFGGYQDILNKRIKILHDKSFIDDPSRIVRALKFKKRLGFDFDKKTLDLMLEYLKEPNREMPFERIKSELKQYFSINRKDLYNDYLKFFVYKLFTDNPIIFSGLDKLEEMIKLRVIDIKDISEFYFILSVLGEDSSCLSLNLNSQESKIILEVKALLDNPFSGYDKVDIYKRYISLNNMSLALYYCISGEKSVMVFLSELSKIKVLVKGKDLIELGFVPSKYFSEIFDSVLIAKINGKIYTKEEEIDFIQKNIKKESI